MVVRAAAVVVHCRRPPGTLPGHATLRLDRGEVSPEGTSMASDDRSLDGLGRTVAGWAEGKPAITRVLLHGSRARGLNKDGGPVREDSDLDVAVEIECRDGDERLDFMIGHRAGWHGELEARLPVPLHLDWYDRQHTPHVVGSCTDGSLVVYERGEAT